MLINEKFYGRQNDNYDFYSSIQSRFIDEIDNEYTEISIDENEEDDFIFDQDLQQLKVKKIVQVGID